ncbi:Alkane 1-monooxygenase 2 [Aquicella siphonis]|uniref:Alkane 1-monooxygenase 2 n=1 Tax=Aquicella siphonis TaxID=254247 RepID=A0A5E4PF26_9COXI|nr:alkane 1-monooxygenase [Aquicella siphonis]VVC75589.1 Alkane 1-monooxygenase 2 [Aquicella siphonis]
MSKTASPAYFHLKKLGYLAFLLLALMPYLSALLGQYSHAPNLSAYLTLSFSFILVPLLDHVLGHDSGNPDKTTEKKLSTEFYYEFITSLCVPLQYLMLVFGAYYMIAANLNIWGMLGWSASIGLVNSSVGITAAHELIHKNSFHERLAGGLLLASVCYSTFKVEHIRGHHVWVGTCRDRTTAKYNQSVYKFLLGVLPFNFLSGWKLEWERLVRRGFNPLGWRNELIWWHTLSLVLAVALALLFGWLGLAFFIVQSAVAIIVLEIINYVEHYGLARKQLANGLYEPVSQEHSWNSDFLLSNLMLFHLQRHSDHHQQSKKRFQLLLHHDTSPQLPSGYPAMILLALCPPLWFRIINPKIKNAAAGG